MAQSILKYNFAKTMKDWFKCYSQSTDCQNFPIAQKLLSMSTEANTSVLKFDKDLNMFRLSNNVDEDFLKAGVVLIDFYFYKGSNHFDTVIKFLPKNNSDDYTKILSTKQKKFYSDKSNKADYAIFLLNFAFSNYKKYDKFPKSALTDMCSKVNGVDGDTYANIIIENLKKKAKNTNNKKGGN